MVDKERRSPLLLAASKSGWRTVQTLTEFGANIHLKDTSFRNVLHLIVMNGGNLEEFASLVVRVHFRSCMEVENFLLIFLVSYNRSNDFQHYLISAAKN